MARLLTLLRIALFQPRTATERRLRAVVVVVVLCAVVLAVILFAGKTVLSAANATQQIDLAVGEFKRVAEPMLRRLHSIKQLAVTDGLDLRDAEALRKIRTVAIEPLEQVQAVMWSDSSRFEQMHVRPSAGEAEWRVVSSAGMDIKSWSADWYRFAVEELDARGDGAHISWCGVGDPPPTEQAEVIASLAWRSRDDPGIVQVVAFVIDHASVAELLDQLDFDLAGALLVFADTSSPVAPAALEGDGQPSDDRTVMSLSKHNAFADQLVEFRPLRRLIDDTQRDFGPEAASLIESPDEQRVLYITHNRQLCACAARLVSFEQRDLWLIVALPNARLALFNRSVPVLVTLLVVMMVLGMATLVHMALRTSESLERLSRRTRYSEAPVPMIEALIRGGETESVEFKSTLRWNIRAERPGKEISHAVLKSIAAFCNSDGGTLLVGVEDDGSILGIEADRFSNEDKYLLHFNNMLKEHLDMSQAATLSFALRDLGGMILVIDCPRCEEPMFVRQGDEQEYFVRLGPGTRKLTGHGMLEYIRNRGS